MRSLMPLRLQGTGTRNIESLPSYLLRLSSAHGVTPGRLFRYLLNTYPGGIEVGSVLGSQPFPAVARPTSTTDELIGLLAMGRCEHIDQLRRATFLFLSPALARSPKSFSNHLRWCPGCLHDQQASGVPAHHKLSWLLSDVKNCEVHQVALRESCPHCDLTPSPAGGWWDLTLCPSCNGALDKITRSDTLDASPEGIAPDLLSVVEGIASRSEPFPPGCVNRYVDRVFSEAWASEREMELWKRLPKDECIRYAEANEPVTLGAARRIAFRLEVPMLELLEASRPTLQSFGFANDAPLPAPMQPTRKPHSIGRELLRIRLDHKLKWMLKGYDSPRSLRQIARSLSVSVGAIQYHAADLAEQIINFHSMHQASEASRRRHEAAAAVRQCLEADRKGEPLSKKGVLRDLRSTTRLPKNLLMAEIKAQWLG